MSELEYEQIAEYVMPNVSLAPADIGFLFGTRHGVEQFCQVAYTLWEQQMFQRLLVSGGNTAGGVDTEAQVISQRLLAMGMPGEALILEARATNTGENVIFGRDKIAQCVDLASIRSVLLIGKVCSLRRYLMTFERHWPGPTRFACPVNYFGVPHDRWHEHDEFRSRVLGEFDKIPAYLEQDFLRELPGFSGRSTPVG